MVKPLYQQIYERYQLHPAQHMTHIDNLPTIIERGIVSHNQMQHECYKNISNEDVQRGRAEKIVMGRSLHDYVPLYFGLKTPMAACNQDLNESVILLRVSLSILTQKGVVFSDGNARSSSTSFYTFEGIDSLEVLDVKAIHSVKYKDDLEKKRRKQAEILIPNKIDFLQVHDIFVYSEKAKEQVMNILLQYDKKLNVSVESNWYFESP